MYIQRNASPPSWFLPILVRTLHQFFFLGQLKIQEIKRRNTITGFLRTKPTAETPHQKHGFYTVFTAAFAYRAYIFEVLCSFLHLINFQIHLLWMKMYSSKLIRPIEKFHNPYSSPNINQDDETEDNEIADTCTTHIRNAEI